MVNKLFDNVEYKRLVQKSAELFIDWSYFRKKTVLITGATGMIGTYLTDVLMYRNHYHNDMIKIVALGRNQDRCQARFSQYDSDSLFLFISHDINISLNLDIPCDVLIHAASNTHPVQYASDPIGTISANIIGTKNILEYARTGKQGRVVFVSSVEVYGENRGDTEKFSEDYCGYIDCNTLRAGYPESKRAGEALCQAYLSVYNTDLVIPRLSRVYGPTMLWEDSKAVAQFIKKAVHREDIILKSHGNQYYSYSYISDAVAALLYIIIYGEKGQAYNIADAGSDITLKDMAHILADIAGTRVIFELPKELELAGYSKTTKGIMNADKLKSLGWKSNYEIQKGLEETVRILSCI